ncbi:hypothetical protein TNCV_3143091 [Trichonephila clavipes]|nr:hypothetical protein TNCV_3143091 [Trichonephila clavipes]
MLYLLKGSSLKNSLENYTENFRSKFGKVEQEATNLSGLLLESEPRQARRQQKREITFDKGKKVVHEFERRENFKVNSFCVKCDRTKAELSRRAEVYELLQNTLLYFLKRLLV